MHLFFKKHIKKFGSFKVIFLINCQFANVAEQMAPLIYNINHDTKSVELV